MAIIEKIVLSVDEPRITNVLWLKDRQLYGFIKGTWEKLCEIDSDLSDITESIKLSLTDSASNKEILSQLALEHKAKPVYICVVNLDDDLAGKGLLSLTTATGEATIVYFENSTVSTYTVSSAGVVTAGYVTGMFDNLKYTELTLTESQKAQARTNISVYSTSETYSKEEVDEKLAYIDLVSYGIQWDTTISNPQCTRIGNPLFHKELPIQSSMRGCIHNGSSIAYYLDANDWSKKEDGVTASVLDGTDGEVGVHIMKFYGKSGSNGTKRWVRISTIKVDDTWVEIPEAIVGAYRCTVDKTVASTPKAVSVVNTTANYRGGGDRSAYDDVLATYPFKTDLGKPRTALSRATMRTYATNAGNKLMFYNYYKWMCWLYFIEYANFNCQVTFNAALTSEGYHQGGLGAGVSSVIYTDWTTFNGNYPLVPCGYTNQFGNGSNIRATGAITDGTTTLTTQDVPRWRGIEQPFGDIWTNLDGIICKGFNDDESVYHRYYYATWDPTKFGDDETAVSNMEFVGEEVQSNGYVGEYTLGTTGEMVPADVTGGSTTKKCDYHYQDSPNVGLRTVLVGSNANLGAYAGLSYFDSDLGVGVSAANVGFRTISLV